MIPVKDIRVLKGYEMLIEKTEKKLFELMELLKSSNHKTIDRHGNETSLIDYCGTINHNIATITWKNNHSFSHKTYIIGSEEERIKLYDRLDQFKMDTGNDLYPVKSLFISDYKNIDFLSANFTDRYNKTLGLVVLHGDKNVGKSNILSFIKKSHDNSFLINGREDMDVIEKYLCGVSHKGELNTIIETFMDNLGFDYRVKNINEKLVMTLENSEGHKTNLHDLGNSDENLVKTILYPIVLISRLNLKVLLIDNVGDNLHPREQFELINVYKKIMSDTDCQIFLATTSPLVLSRTRYRNLFHIRYIENKLYITNCGKAPIDNDIDSILKSLMNVRVTEIRLEFLKNKYRDFVNKDERDSVMAKRIRNEILEYISSSSSYFQDVDFEF